MDSKNRSTAVSWNRATPTLTFWTGMCLRKASYPGVLQALTSKTRKVSHQRRIWCWHNCGGGRMSPRLLQINLKHSKAASAALLLYLAGGEADVVLIQEHWVCRHEISALRTTEYTLLLLPNFHKEDNTTVCLEGIAKFLRLCSSSKIFTTILFKQNLFNYALWVKSLRQCSPYMNHDQTRSPLPALRRALVADSETKTL